MNEFVSVHTSDEQPGIATLLLSRPPTNALTRQVYREIISAATDLGRREDISSVILFGGHEIFCAGDDMPELSTLSADEAEVAARMCREAVDSLAAIPKPTVAAITSWKLGPSIACPRMMLRMIRNGAAKARIGTAMNVEGLGPLSSTRKLKARLVKSW